MHRCELDFIELACLARAAQPHCDRHVETAQLVLPLRLLYFVLPAYRAAPQKAVNIGAAS